MKTAILLLLSLPNFVFSTEFYVAPNGSDSNAGTKEKPFLTFEAAQHAIRCAKGTDVNSVTVWMRGGIYERTKPFELSADDSLSNGGPVVYGAFENEKVIITGARKLDAKDFTAVKESEVLNAFDPNSRNKVLQYDLFAHGIKDLGNIEPMGLYHAIMPTEPELFYNDKPMTIARWPNTGWTKTAEVKADGAAPGPPAESKETVKGSNVEIGFSGERPAKWTHSKDIRLFGFWKWDWCDSTLKVGRIDLDNTKFIIPEQPTFGVDRDRRYYAFNILEEIDSPGEYYIDREKGLVYFYPPDGFEGGKISLSLLKTPLISINGANNIRVQGITFEGTRGTAIQIQGGRNNVIAGCTIRNCGNVAVNIGCGVDGAVVGNYLGQCYSNTTWNRNAGTGNGVLSCDIFNMGEGGIIIGGGDRPSLTAGGNFAKNNRIHDFNRRTKTCRPGISIDGVGNIAANNVVYDGPHNGLVFWGNDHLIQYNEFYNLCTETGDVGVIYTGRDYTARGSKIIYNYIHDTAGPVGKDSAQAIYLDDLASGIEIVGNIICNVQTGIFVGGGRDNLIKNNFLADCGRTIWIDQRGLETWFTMHTNPEDSILIKRMNSVPYKKDPWLSKYPKLAVLLDDEQVFAPKGNVVENNSAFNCGIPIENEVVAIAKQCGKLSDNLDIKTDPNSDTVSNKVHRCLRIDSKIFKSLPGFEKSPIQKIGLYEDSLRKNL